MIEDNEVDILKLKLEPKFIQKKVLELLVKFIQQIDVLDINDLYLDMGVKSKEEIYLSITGIPRAIASLYLVVTSFLLKIVISKR